MSSKKQGPHRKLASSRNSNMSPCPRGGSCGSINHVDGSEAQRLCREAGSRDLEFGRYAMNLSAKKANRQFVQPAARQATPAWLKVDVVSSVIADALSDTEGQTKAGDVGKAVPIFLDVLRKAASDHAMLERSQTTRLEYTVDDIVLGLAPEQDSDLFALAMYQQRATSDEHLESSDYLVGVEVVAAAEAGRVISSMPLQDIIECADGADGQTYSAQTYKNYLQSWVRKRARAVDGGGKTSSGRDGGVVHHLNGQYGHDLASGAVVHLSTGYVVTHSDTPQNAQVIAAVLSEVNWSRRQQRGFTDVMEVALGVADRVRRAIR